MNDYFVMWEVAHAWKAATEDLKVSVHAVIDTSVKPAIARHGRLAGLGIVLIYVAAALIWMIL